jgi:hypothetical protein
MNICTSCKNKNSNERCTLKSLPHISFCGKHARVKEPRIWHSLHNVKKLAENIQKLWKGYYIRKRLKLAGPGVLKRSLCHNDEELITAEDKNRQYPLDYFGFEENDKVWWFDIRSLIEWSFQNQEFLNPYTKQPFSIVTRRRFRELLRMRIWVDNEPILINKLDIVKLEGSKWVRLCQEIEETLFTEVNPMLFAILTRNQIWRFTNHLRTSFKTWTSEQSKSVFSRRLECLIWVEKFHEFQKRTENNLAQLSSYLSRLLLGIISYVKDSQHVSFMILGALYRL